MSLQKNTLSILARSGYAARAVVYLLVGGLALLAALGAGGKTTGGKGALQTLLDEPFGTVILTCIGIGLLAYALWRVVQAVADADGHGTDFKALSIRASLLTSAVLHFLLAFFVFKLILSAGSEQTKNNTSLVGDLMGSFPGRALLIFAALAIVVAGLSHAYKGWAVRFDRHFAVPASLQSWLYPLCRIGLISRGVVLVIVGGLLMLAVYHLDASQAGGMDKAFAWLREQTLGNVLLAVISVGLLAFAAYSLIEARYRKINLRG
ncbi:DUF1206 domain-containing protein [Gilvimarinus sp. DA14]|uniref:DUF1206 domain-containing protein n=1 Tax=Gilvimarinus sp. DA14 TaxID=2956798 RepID=UPI0020B6DF6F|nr:DUF1206 domain-containing protein [Gilvimarinus sp. DA14]UTF59220.1 DUF1206 domain-containing protein [Gilvimarinus sp. DA14]